MSEPAEAISGTKLGAHRTYGRLARASVMWGYVRSGILMLVGIPTTIILARLLTPEEFGIAATATFFGQLSGRLSSSGMGSALVRVKVLRPEHISTVFTINAAATVFMVLGLVAISTSVAEFYGRSELRWVLRVVALNFAFGALSNVQQALLRRDLRYKEMTTIGSLDVTTAGIVSVMLAAVGFGYWGLVLADLSGAIVKFLYGVRVAGWHARLQFDRSAARELSSFAAGSFFRRLLEQLTRNVDNLVVGRMLGMTALGFYDKAFSLANRLYARMIVVGPSVSFRIFSIIQDEPERFRLAYHKVIMTATLINYTLFAVLGVMAPHLIVIAFGERWQPTVVPLQLLCVSFALKVLNQYAITASDARGWVWPHVWRQVVQVACIVGGVYLATPWGINGAAIAVVGAGVVMFFLTQGMMRSATGLGWADILRPQVPAVSLATVLIATLWGIDSFLATRSTAPLVIMVTQALAAATIVLAFAWRCPFADARVLMHDTVGDVSPRIAGWLWRDVATQQRADRARRRGGLAQSSEFDSGAHLASSKP